MYQRQIIDIVDPHVTTSIVEIRDAYEVRKDRPAVWLQTVCCWVLDKLGAHSWRNDRCVNYTRVDVTDIFDMFEHQYNEVYRITGRAPSKVLIGYEDFARMVNAPQSHKAITFNVQVYDGPYHRGKVHGINVHVLPWMQGILIVP